MKTIELRHILRGGTALLSGMAAMTLLAPVASAQSAEQSAEPVSMAEIIVTANRREERGQDVPISITAISPQRLEQQGINKEQDLQASVPSLVVGPNGQGSRDSNSFTLRGQGATFQASPGVVVYLNEIPLPSGITLSQQGGPGNFVDLENMQVLAGPQGTLFGRNTTGGAVLLVPKKPTDSFGGWVKGEYGNYDRKYLEGAINLPVNEKLAVRVVGAYHDRDGYTRDVVWNKDRDNEHWYSGRVGILFRPTETITNYTMVYGSYSKNNGAGLIHRGFNIDSPGGLADLGLCANLPVGVVGGYSCDVYRATTAQADALGPRKTAFSTDTFSKTETWGVSNTTDIELSDEITLRNIVSYQKMKVGYRYDGDATVLQQHDVDPGRLPAPGVVTLPGTNFPVTYLNSTGATELPRDNLRVWTEELQLQGTMLDGNLNWTVGGFYYDQRPDGLQGSRAVLYCPAVTTGLCTASQSQYGTSTVSKALYGQATLDFAALSPALDGLRLTGGYRQTWDHVYGFATQFNYTSPNPGQVRCGKDNLDVPEATAVEDCRFEGSQRTSSPSWLVGLDYKVSSNILLYGKVSRSYKAGGFNNYAVYFGQGTDPDTRTFLPEKVTSYEIGMKSDFRLGSVPLRFNIAGYSTDYKGIQRATGDYNPTTTAGGARTLNADARINGIEIETSVRPFPGVEVGGNFSYTDAKYKKFDYVTPTGALACNGFVPAGGTADASCLDFQYVAPYIWSFHVSAEQPLANDMGTLALYANYSHTSKQNTEAVQLPSQQPGAVLEAFGLLSVSLDWRKVGGSGFDLGLFATNLVNKTYRISNADVYQAGGLLYWATLYGEPRMYGLRVKYTFGGG
ncbi:TonB-dependent receptor [Sphingobium herbicidovorans NBRC 16415]|uniref:TonB-dependent receptor n=1 Tax=Sphingobium herbicidovorans (strain ATCC 700291 / DSM 11019 / CCUG 56400 / KCTC 2939 / LMG 18315 / NBRC 16415 / MH) TaxID=1219045 RepID=A0A086P4P2_SPHHM|nr:TonB-dependent receptor [Sphingobium herbicidovorans]KFG88360.1 TonB-dependent receptor [Sphingobium herbicidovorans NBRC 16415]